MFEYWIYTCLYIYTYIRVCTNETVCAYIGVCTNKTVSFCTNTTVWIEPHLRQSCHCNCVAVCCSVLQCVAVCCSVVAVCCSVLQCCSVIQCSAIVLQCMFEQDSLHRAIAASALPSDACCSVLQCVVACCNVLQCAAVCYIVLQCSTVCCSDCTNTTVCIEPQLGESCHVNCAAVCCSVL